MALQTTYNTGTATINAGETIVTGVGTGWMSFGLSAGDLFWAAGLSVRIASIESNTKLTLAYPWPSASRNAQNYEVRVTPDTSRVLVNARSLLDSLTNGVLSALSGMGDAANKIAYFAGNGVVALAEFPAAARAFLAGGVLPNIQLPARLREASLYASDLNDIVSFGSCATNLQTLNAPLAGYFMVLTMPWIDATSSVQLAYPAALSGPHFIRYKIGNVWQPWSKASAERGSNANGEYVRFGDGTQICWILVDKTNDDWTQNYGGLFVPANPHTWTYPAAFSVQPTVVPGASRYGVGIAAGAMDRDVSTGFANLVPWICLSSPSGSGKSLHAVASGRWF